MPPRTLTRKESFRQPIPRFSPTFFRRTLYVQYRGHHQRQAGEGPRPQQHSDLRPRRGPASSPWTGDHRPGLRGRQEDGHRQERPRQAHARAQELHRSPHHHRTARQRVGALDRKTPVAKSNRGLFLYID